MFSNEWYKLSNTVFQVRRSIEFSRHTFQNKVSYVASVPSNNTHIKISLNAYLFINLLNGKRKLEEALLEFNEQGDRYFSKNQVVELIKNLADKSILQTDDYVGYERIAIDKDRTKEQEVESKWYSFLFVQIPLISPDRFLKATYPYICFLFSKVAVTCCLLFSLYTFVNFLPHIEGFEQHVSSLLSLSNLPWLYLVMVVTKVFHELAHGYTSVKYGGQVTTAGIMLLVFTPLPFVDVSSMWANSSKRKRMVVSSAGIITDFFIASVALIVWMNTASGPLNSIAYNTFFIAFLSTFLFNINPLIKFDGYHILSDAIEVPNLQERSNKLMRHLWRKYIGGDRGGDHADLPARELSIYVIYGVLSFLYRIFLMLTISYVLSLKFLLLGKLLAIFSITLYFIVPLVKTMNQSLIKEKDPYIKKRFNLFYLAVALLLIGLFTIPVPSYSRAKGLVVSGSNQEVHLKIAGIVDQIHVSSGDYVNEGDVLMTLHSLEMRAKMAQLTNQIEAEQINKRVYSNNPEFLNLISLKIEALTQQLQELEELYQSRKVVAQCSGRVFFNSELVRVGNTVNKGQFVFKISNTDDLYFSAVVHQNESAYMFMQEEDARAQCKIYGLEAMTFPCKETFAIPAARSELPSASLGILLGGDVIVDQNARSGNVALEDFFEIRSKIQVTDNVDELQLVSERRGEIRYYIGNRTIGSRVYYWVRKLLQRDHHI